MGEHNYTRALVDSLWDVDLKALAREIVVALPGKLFTLKALDTSITARFVETLTAGEITTLDTAVSDHKAAFDSVAVLRVKRHKAVAVHTSILVEDGSFEYPASSGKFFSLSVLDRVNILGADYSREIPGFSFPVRWYTKDDDDYVDLADATDVRNFFLTALGAHRSLVESGNSLKDSTNAATTKAELDAVVDTR